MLWTSLRAMGKFTPRHHSTGSIKSHSVKERERRRRHDGQQPCRDAYGDMADSRTTVEECAAMARAVMYSHGNPRRQGVG